MLFIKLVKNHRLVKVMIRINKKVLVWQWDFKIILAIGKNQWYNLMKIIPKNKVLDFLITKKEIH